MSNALWEGFLDEAEHKSVRMALVTAAKEGDRLAFDLLRHEFKTWRQAQRRQVNDARTACGADYGEGYLDGTVASMRQWIAEGAIPEGGEALVTGIVRLADLGDREGIRALLNEWNLLHKEPST